MLSDLAGPEWYGTKGVCPTNGPRRIRAWFKAAPGSVRLAVCAIQLPNAGIKPFAERPVLYCRVRKQVHVSRIVEGKSGLEPCDPVIFPTTQKHIQARPCVTRKMLPP